MSSPSVAPQGVKIDTPILPGRKEILTREAITLVADLRGDPARRVGVDASWR
jgi:hypothetical protein